MNWTDQIGNIISQYTGGGTAPASQNVEQDYSRVAQAAPQDVVAGGLSEAFNSNQTPPFPQMVSQLFGQSNNQQQAGLLNSLLASVGPGVLASMAGGGLMSSLSGMLSGGQRQVTPEQASQISPAAVQELATHAQKQDPSVVDQVSGFYAKHPDLVKGLGITALTIAMGRMARQQ